MRLMGRDCRVDASGLGRHTGFVWLDLQYGCYLCFAWRLSETGVVLFETDESGRHAHFVDDDRRNFWTRGWVKRRISRWLRKQDEQMAQLLAWNDGTVAKIAQAIHDERAFKRMPILADALEDAGCDNADMLRHCREPGEHVRGCWVVDLLLGKQDVPEVRCATPGTVVQLLHGKDNYRTLT